MARFAGHCPLQQLVGSRVRALGCVKGVREVNLLPHHQLLVRVERKRAHAFGVDVAVHAAVLTSIVT